jgi:hypothetical protein
MCYIIKLVLCGRCVFIVFYYCRTYYKAVRVITAVPNTKLCAWVCPVTWTHEVHRCHVSTHERMSGKGGSSAVAKRPSGAAGNR